MMMNTKGAPIVPLRKAASGAALERRLTTIIPKTEAISPMLASINGSAIIAA